MTAQAVCDPTRLGNLLHDVENLNSKIQQDSVQALSQETDAEQRMAILQHLHKLCDQIQSRPRARLLCAWHSVDERELPVLLERGWGESKDSGTHCVDFALCDSIQKGIYGRGTYLSTSAEHALRLPKSGNCLILCCEFRLIASPNNNNRRCHG